MRDGSNASIATTVVVPTIGRPSLRVLLEALARGEGPAPAGVIVVDDRTGAEDLDAELGDLDLPVLRVARSGGGGPAKARNLGWRLARTPWVSFLDDDVTPLCDWKRRLADDLASADNATAGSQGRVDVPLPTDRRHTDWERGTAGLETARWITADMSYRRSALAAVGGFDERFPRAYREDADLGLRVSRSQGRIVTGCRQVLHPVRPADDWVSLRQQAGNADDALMRRLHGPRWRELVGAPRGRRPRHLGTTAAAAAAVGLSLARCKRAAAVAAAAWVAGTVELAAARIAKGPRDAHELRRMTLTSVAIPFAATAHLARGTWRHRAAAAWRGVPELVLFDRDGTVVLDVPYNADPQLVSVTPDAAESIRRLRDAGVRIGLVTNQSGIAKRLLTRDQAEAVNARVEELLGPFDVVELCPHDSGDGCECRKPAPGMIKHACRELGVETSRCVVIGDIGSDVEAAQAAGAVGILVPNAATAASEVGAAEIVCPSLKVATQRLLGGSW